METVNEKVKVLAKELGASDTGFADLTSLDKNLNKNFDYGISIMIRLSTGILSQMTDAPTITYFSHYRAVNRLIDSITLRLSLMLEEEGYPSFAVPASQSEPGSDFGSVFPHKTAATLSGKGWIGKNALFIHKEFGPAVRLGTVLTNAPLKTEKPELKSHCGICDKCRKSCPAMAIEGKEWKPGLKRNEIFDAYSCSFYMKDAFHHIGRGVVCGLCIINCPYFIKNK